MQLIVRSCLLLNKLYATYVASLFGEIAYKLSVQFTLAKHFDVSKPFPWEELLRTSPNAAAPMFSTNSSSREAGGPGAAKVPRFPERERGLR